MVVPQMPGVLGKSELLCLSGLVVTTRTLAYVTKEDLSSGLASLEDKLANMF